MCKRTTEREASDPNGIPMINLDRMINLDMMINLDTMINTNDKS